MVDYRLKSNPIYRPSECNRIIHYCSEREVWPYNNNVGYPLPDAFGLLITKEKQSMCERCHATFPPIKILKTLFALWEIKGKKYRGIGIELSRAKE